jgi:alanine racemase
MRKTQVTINLPALRHNLRKARNSAFNARVMAAIKANGYGHGLVRVARALAEADSFGVACLDEAIQLREAGIDKPITLLEGLFHLDELAAVMAHDLELVLHHPHQLGLLEQGMADTPVKVWLKVDSGMHRLGFPPEGIGMLWQRLSRLGERVSFLGFMTHLANADDREDQTTAWQLECFSQALAELPGERSIANSAAILGWPESHSDWVRPGIMLYGASPFLGGRGSEEGLQPVMTLHSELIAINPMKRGDAIGYGGTWRCPEDMAVGVVAVGYGDGYPRHAPTGTPVLINGVRVPLIGRVSMDMITVDLRTLPGAKIGDPVVLWGDGLAVEEIAEMAGTISYELLCGITQRVAVRELDGGV